MTIVSFRRDKHEESGTALKRALSEIKEVDSEAASSDRKQTRAYSNAGNDSMT